MSTTPAVAVPAPDRAKPKPPTSKIQTLIDLLRRPQGATLAEMMSATKWQAHSIRGAMSGALKKKAGLVITSDKADGARAYRIGEDAQ
jgi:predicted nucleic acid-binding Zn ribbon protein